MTAPLCISERGDDVCDRTLHHGGDHRDSETGATWAQDETESAPSDPGDCHACGGDGCGSCRLARRAAAKEARDEARLNNADV